jgi:Cof subfamily protein (haloacid dehalogenase superfamily)
MIKLIATDIDGTFFDDEHQYNYRRFNRQLDLLHERGINFVIASGNYLGHLQEVVKHSPVDGFVSENGAHIVIHNENIFSAYLSSEIILQIIEKLYSLGDDFRSFILSGERHTYVNRKYLSTLNKYYVRNYSIYDDLNEIDDRIFKVNIGINNDHLQEVEDFLNDEFPDQVHATASGFGNIDIVAGGVDKSIGLQKVANFYDISLKDIVVFGDNSNDNEMLLESGIGYAMKNGMAGTKELADRVTKYDNNHEGVLETIDELFNWDTK